jgi:leader peptidase (prepilin peptidase)/N-methyltransferase
MEIYLSVISFILGLIIGSFLNVCIGRIPERQSLILPSSHCPVCKTSLKPLDLIPVFSWIFLKGRCRYCGTKISVQYPLVELLTGCLFLLNYVMLGISISFLFSIIITSLLITISFIDLRHYIIPDVLNITLLITVVLFRIVTWNGNILDPVLGLIAGGGLFLLIHILTKGRGMGLGDVKLIAVLGLYFGLAETMVTVVLSFIIGAVIMVVLLLTKIKKRKDQIPFGPYIALAAYFTMLFGPQMLNWYLSMI